MIENEPKPARYYDEHDIWTLDPTAADAVVYERFASTIVDLVNVLDDTKPMMSRDVYARLFDSLLNMSRILGQYEESWGLASGSQRTD